MRTYPFAVSSDSTVPQLHAESGVPDLSSRSPMRHWLPFGWVQQRDATTSSPHSQALASRREESFDPERAIEDSALLRSGRTGFGIPRCIRCS